MWNVFCLFMILKIKICVIILFWYLITKLRKYKSLSMVLPINSEVLTRTCSATLLKRDSKVFLWILWSFKNTHFVEHLRKTLLNHLIWDCIVPINIVNRSRNTVVSQVCIVFYIFRDRLQVLIQILSKFKLIN